MDGSGLITQHHRVAFLDEFRIIIVSFINRDPGEAPDLLVLDTLVPQGHPGHLRRFNLPQKYCGLSVIMYLDGSRPLGTLNGDSPLIVDPSQAVFLVKLVTPRRDPRAVLILRVQSLIEHVCSTREGVQIPWDVWGKGAMAMEVRNRSNFLPLAIHGSRVLATLPGRERINLTHVFDFSLRGKDTLRFLNGNGDGEVVLEDGPWVSEGHDGLNLRGNRVLGDSLVTMVCLSYCSRGSYS